MSKVQSHSFMNRKNVLICDDNSRVRSGLKLILEDHFCLFFAEDEKEVFDFIFKENIDLILIDYCLKESNGTEIINRVKNKCPLIRIIMLTGYKDDDLKPKALVMGADDFIIKPFKSLDLIGAIQKLLS